MKTASIRNKSTDPSTLQIAVLPEDFTLPSISETAPSPGQTPFSELMLHPDKLEAALKTARIENDAFDASRTISRGVTSNRTTPDAPSRSTNGGHKFTKHSRAELKIIEFYIEAPSAVSVKLAADFTDWDKYPLDMIKAQDGVWSFFIPLSPGNYSYRFIVDGKWHDDPCADSYEPNPFGAANAVLKVT